MQQLNYSKYKFHCSRFNEILIRDDKSRDTGVKVRTWSAMLSAKPDDLCDAEPRTRATSSNDTARSSWPQHVRSQISSAEQ